MRFKFPQLGESHVCRILCLEGPTVEFQKANVKFTVAGPALPNFRARISFAVVGLSSDVVAVVLLLLRLLDNPTKP